MSINIEEFKSFLNYDYDIPFATRLCKQFFWPLYRYKVAVKGVKSEDNLFETFLLKFVSAGNHDMESLQKLTGMDLDLLVFLLRLYR